MQPINQARADSFLRAPVGFTTILGKLITLPALPLVWWRMLLVALALLLIPSVWSGLRSTAGARVPRNRSCWAPARVTRWSIEAAAGELLSAFSGADWRATAAAVVGFAPRFGAEFRVAAGYAAQRVATWGGGGGSGCRVTDN